MRDLRGFSAQDVVACFTEAAGGGGIKDFDAPRNAPAKSPEAHLDKIAFHSDFFQYELAMPLQTVTVTHPAVAASGYAMSADAFPAGGNPLSLTVFGQQVSGSNVLLEHGLDYVPLSMVAWNARMVVGGTIVQSTGANLRRFVSSFSNATQVGINWCGYSGAAALPAISITYQVLVFRTPAANPAVALFSGNPSAFQLGRGKINSASQYLRHKLPDESWFDFDLERTVDLANGGARVVTGGNVQNDPFYSGSFAGGGYVPVGV